MFEFDGFSDSDSLASDDESSSDDDDSSSSGSAISLPSNPEILDGIVPGSDLQLNTEFQSEEDATIFGGISSHHYLSSVIPLKNGTKDFLNYSFHSQLSDDGKRQIGVLFAQNHSQIRQMNIKFSEEQPQLVSSAIFRGPFTEGHALIRFIIRGDDLHSPITLSLNDWNGIKRYLNTADNLSHLELNDLVMGRLEVEILVSALTGAQLKTLKLSGLFTSSPNDGGVDSLGTLLSSMNVSRLKTVDIVDCNATARGTCDGLANIIRNNLSKLEIINLDGNEINDECVSVLCQSLKHNTSVHTIHLNDMDEITDGGWKLFKTLVFDRSSIESVYLSNHTLREIKGHPQEPYDPAYINKIPGHTTKTYLKVIRFLTNDRYYDLANGTWERSVVWELGDDCFNIQPFVDYDVEIMPYVLGFFGKKAQSEVCNNFVYKPLFFIYQLLRLWDVPTLFGFGSAEKARLSAEMNVLKKENQSLLNEVETLRAELSRVKTGNTSCEQEREGEEKQRSKRTRADV